MESRGRRHHLSDSERPRAHTGSPRTPAPLAPDRGAAAVELGSVELAVVAELNLELARAYDEVADDATQGSETRRQARARAFRRRVRAGLLHIEAQRVRARASVSDGLLTHESNSPYSGPERRKQERRFGERRGHSAAPATPPGADRRADRDRRRHDRRRPSLVSS
jgi:hypothetical protein